MYINRYVLLTTIVAYINPTRCADLFEFLVGPRIGTRNLNASYRTASELVTGYGYSLETHRVESQNGYIIEMHRIPKPREILNEKSIKPVVLLHHGFLGSSDMWFIRGPDKDLPFIMADAGFDVWLTNTRGNTYSRNHRILDPDVDADYWNFDIFEMGYYDLANCIDYILNVTEQKDLFFISHSMGSSAGFVLLSLKPEYNAKIRLFIALAPLTYVKHRLSSIHKFMIRMSPVLSRVILSKNIQEVFPRRDYFSRIAETLCDENMPTHRFCLDTATLVVGNVDKYRFNTSILSELIAHYPSGTSLKTFLSVFQFYLTGDFTRFDYGNVRLNMLYYNSTTPPVYDLSKVKCPVTLHYGTTDLLVEKIDVDYLANQLQNVIGTFQVPAKSFNHIDFVFATDANRLLYKLIVDLVNKYS